MKLSKSLFLSLLVLVPSTSLFGEWVCLRSDGCRMTETGCEGCIQVETPKLTTPTPDENEKKNQVVEKMVSSGGGFIENGKYRITKVVNNDGFHLVWDKGVILDISLISNENIYIVKVMGVGSVKGQVVDCSHPLIFSMKLDTSGNVLKQTIVDNGNEGCSISSYGKDRWFNTSDGLKKVKSYTQTDDGKYGWECVIPPCDWIHEKTHTFHYTRLL